MTTDRFDQTIRDWVVDRAVGSAPDRLHAQAMALVRGRRQRGSLSAAVRTALNDNPRFGPVQLGTALRLAALLALTLVLGVMLGLAAGSKPPVQPSPTAPQPTPGASLLAANFVRPFTYRFPTAATDDFHAVIEVQDLQGFASGSFSSADAEYGYGSIQLKSPRGVVVMALGEPWVDPCPSQHGIRPTAAEFLNDLQVFGGLTSDPVIAVTLDGKAALTTLVRANHKSCPGDFHYDRGPSHASNFISLWVASQLTVLEVDGVTIVIDIWAQTDADFDAWLPSAREFVDSIHFVGQPSPSATSTMEPEPSATAQPTLTPGPTGAWQVTPIEHDPINGQPTAAASLYASEGTAPSGDRVGLRISCSGGRTSLFVDWHRVLNVSDRVPVEYQIGDRAPVTETWRFDVYGESSLLLFAEDLVADMFGQRQFTVGPAFGLDRNRKSTFDVTGVENAVTNVREACGW